jgi:integrase
MRVLMGIVSNEYGVYHVRRKVPDNLGEAVSRLTGSSRPRVAWLKRSLGTKDIREANIRAKPIMMDFDRLLARAEASLKAVPIKAGLSDQEIKRMASYHYAEMLGEDEEHRAGDIDDTAKFGLSDRRFRKLNESLQVALAGCEAALAQGDISIIADQLDELLKVHGFDLERAGDAYRKLGGAVLREHVRALRDMASRSEGLPIESPRLDLSAKQTDTGTGQSLRAAFKGWQKARAPSPSTVQEYSHAVDRFVELHGDLPVAEIKRRHVLAFREALQDIPTRRAGKLRNADLPTLVDWRLSNPNVPRIAPGTVNKLLGGVQAVAVWARDNGFISDDTPWADPFANMRLEEAEPDREPWRTEDLVKLFASPVYAKGVRPKAGGGEAAFWLPVMGMFTGARLGELAPLRLSDIAEDAGSGVTFISIVEDVEDGKSLKTASSRRMVPVHPELVRLGLLDFIAKEAGKRGKDAALFPLLKPGANGGAGETWSKWFGRYIRANGITSRTSVFHSFRHGFKDALRAAKVSEDINDALTGHSGGGVGRRYGAKDMVRRFGAEALRDAVALVSYPGATLEQWELSNGR